MNKRGQQMTLGTIIAIVLGIAVLVFLIFGFSTGWNNMWSKITNLGGGENNVDSIVKGCDLACLSQGEYGYCTQVRELDDGEGHTEIGSCRILSKSGYGIAKCSNLECGANEIVAQKAEVDW